MHRPLHPTRFPIPVALVLLGACALEGGEELPDFCQEVLADVDAYLGSFDEPEGDEYGGTAVVGGIGEIPDGMNAFRTADHGASQHQIFVNQMTLVRYDEDYEPEPYLASSWDLSEDGRELTFHLRDDVHWHDGEPVTAEDVAFTFLRANDPETGFPNAAFWTHYSPGEDGVEVLDSHTVRFHMEPHAEPLDSWRVMAIMPEHLLGDVPPAELRGHPFGTECPVGAGPFRFVDHRDGESWTFARNPAFPDELGGPPRLDRYVYRVVPEPSTLLTEVLTERVDIYLQPTPEHAERLEEEEGARLLSFPFRDYVFVAWNSRRPQLSDARVRRALTLATGRERIVEAVLGGRGSVANAGVPPSHWAHDETLVHDLPYHPDEARRLLAEAGWEDRSGDGIRESDDGESLEISILYNTGNQQRREIAEIMQAQLAEVGVSVRPQGLEWATLVSRVTDPAGRDFDGVTLAWVTEFKVDDTDLFHSDRSDGAYAWSGLQDERMDQLLDSLQVIQGREEALPLWREYQERLVELQPFTYFYFRDRTAGVRERLEGVHMDARGEWVSVADWWIPEGARRGTAVAARDP